MAVMTARAVISLRCGELPVRLLNLEAESVNVYKKTRIVQVEFIELPEVTCINPTELDQGEEVIISDRQRITEDIQVSLWKVVEKCGHLCDGERQQLHSLLIAYNDIFTQLLKTRQTLDKQVESEIELRLVRLLPSGGSSK